uniref:Uncharacterized protein n=1 Tax=Glossina palpalis gambiensis TaxID=67801 RepID=A0A1B0BB57_9MUSC
MSYSKGLIPASRFFFSIREYTAISFCNCCTSKSVLPCATKEEANLLANSFLSACVRRGVNVVGKVCSFETLPGSVASTDIALLDDCTNACFDEFIARELLDDCMVLKPPGLTYPDDTVLSLGKV